MVAQSGYQFKKGKSRSKSLQGSDPEVSSKRCKTSETLRTKRISELDDDIKDYNDRLSFKEKRRQQASNSRNYKLCDQLTEEMADLKQKKRECENELNVWKQKQKKSSWYNKKKKGTSASSTEIISESDSTYQPKKRKTKQSTLAHTSKKSLSKPADRPTLFDFGSFGESSSADEMLSDSEVGADVSSLASTPQACDLKLPALPITVDLTAPSKSASSSDTAVLNSNAINDTIASSNGTTVALANTSESLSSSHSEESHFQ